MELLRIIAELRNPVCDTIFELVTYLGSDIIGTVFLVVMLLSVNRRLAYKTGIAYFTSGVMVNVLKLMFRIERPWILDPEFKTVGNSMESATGYSFPSGHTHSATIVFANLGMAVKNKGLKIAAYIVIPIVMFSRMYLGCHTLKDVVVSFLVSLAFLIVIELLYPRLEKSRSLRMVFLSVALIYVAISLIYAYYICGEGIVSLENTTDMFKMGGCSIAFLICWILDTEYIHYDEHSDRLWKHLLKITVGFAVVMGLKLGLKPVLGEGLIGSLIRYAAMIFWVAGLYPWIIMRIKATKTDNE